MKKTIVLPDGATCVAETEILDDVEHINILESSRELSDEDIEYVWTNI